MAGEQSVQDAAELLELFGERVRLEWEAAIVRALSEPIGEDVQPGTPRETTPIARLAVRAVAEAWPHAEPLLRPIFDLLVTRDGVAEPRPESGKDFPARVTVRPAAWLSAEEAASLVGITAHTLRRLAKADKSPIIVRRMGGRWWFSRADVERISRHGP